MAKKKVKKAAKKVAAPAKMMGCCTDGKCSCENKAIGLALGLLVSGAHLVWLVLVYIGLAKIIMDWILGLHMMKFTYAITPFDFWKGISLLILTFIIGYILGYILAGLLKMARNK